MAETPATRHGPDVRLPADVGNESVRLALLPQRTRLNLRCHADTAAAVAAALGTLLPLEPNRWTGDDRQAVVWLGPDEWLVLATAATADDLADRVRTAAADDPWLSLVDVSHNYTGFLLTGSAARQVLAKGCPLDLHPRTFGTGDCAQSVLAGTRILLRSTDSDGTFEILVRNSFARYTADWLLDAMAEYLEQ